MIPGKKECGLFAYSGPTANPKLAPAPKDSLIKSIKKINPTRDVVSKDSEGKDVTTKVSIPFPQTVGFVATALYEMVLGEGATITKASKIAFTYPKYYTPSIGGDLRCKIDTANPPKRDAYCVVRKDFMLEIYPAPDLVGTNPITGTAEGTKVYIEIFNFDTPAFSSFTRDKSWNGGGGGE